MNRSLKSVRARLEDAVAGLPAQATSNAELYDLYEEIAFQVLDSQEMNYKPGILEEYLMAFLQLKRLELGLWAYTTP